MLKKIIILGVWLLVLMCCLIACDGGDNLKGIETTPIESVPLELSSEEKKVLGRIETEMIKDYPEYREAATQEAIWAAKQKIDEQIKEYDNHSIYYLSVDEEGYLCLNTEIIVPIPKEERNEMRGCGDHEHVFITERICSKEIGVDNEKESKTSYSVTMKNKEWLYEDLKPSYKAGEEVVVKIGIVTDTGYFLVGNGEKIEEDAWESNRDWWQFTFTMPQEDVVIEFKTYDGFLQYPNEALLIETYWLANPTAEYVRVKHYYGEYESGAIVAMIEAGDYAQAAWMESIELYDVWYNDGNRILVLFNGNFYTLTEAYENKYLTIEDIIDIRAQQLKLYEHLGPQDE